MKTKILVLFLAIAPLAAQAQFTFTTNSGAITITGYNTAAGLNVVIPASTNGYPVTAIGTNAFVGLTTITNVTIPDSVTSIGEEAFGHCSGLTSVTIGTNVTSTGDYAFFECYDLTNVTIGNGVTNIGDYAFADCFGLTSITIPNSITSIGDDAFAACFGLTSVTIGNSVTSIGDSAFYYCYDLTSVMIANSVTSIGDNAFFNCSLTSVTIPNSVTSIGDNAFNACSGLTNITFSGNAPLVDGAAGSADSSVFANDPGTVYYFAGTSGWGSTYGGLPTVELFAPQIGGVGVQASGNFGFTITGVSNQTVTVEASSNLVNWQVIQTITLSGTPTNFTDAQWTNFPMRFYRAVGPFTVGGTVTGLAAWDSITLQDNGGDELTLSTNGPFTFATPLADGQTYSVTLYTTSGQVVCTFANGSGTISGANVTNVAVSCHDGCPALTGNKDLDMYNAAVSDGDANGGVPAVMLTENGGPFRVTAAADWDVCSIDVARAYPGWAVFTYVVGTYSCSSTTLPSGTPVIQFGTLLECGDDTYGY